MPLSIDGESSMKFDENCRRRVIRELQRHFLVDLRKVGHLQNYLVDNKDVRYIVLGGVDSWHEIPHSIFRDEESAAGDTVLVIATLDGNILDIFVGPFRPMLEHRDRLSVDKDHYVFHLHRFTTRLLVREIPSLELKQITPRPLEEGRHALRKTVEKLKRREAIAVARSKEASSTSKAKSRIEQRVVAVEGNLIRADFRRREPK
jgi:uncharacterized protein YlxP (DUF503 family)